MSSSSCIRDIKKIVFMLLGLGATCCSLRIWHWDGMWHLRQCLCLHAMLWTWLPFSWRMIRRVEVDWIQQHIIRNDFIEGLSRSMTFVSQVAIIFLMYWFTPLRGTDPISREKESAELRTRCAEQALDLITGMKGYYIKATQTLCGAGLFPKEFNEAFGVLLDQCPKEPFPVIKKIIESELRCRLEDAFDEFQEDPIAAASIGQVHFARLKDGSKVAVKIQYPDVERFFYMDVRTVGFMAGISGMGSKVKDVFKKLKENMEQEFDYTREAAIMNECASNVLPVFSEGVTIPRPLDGKHPSLKRCRVRTLCSRKVLTMERLDGTPIRKHTLKLLESFAGQFGTTVDELKDLLTTTDPRMLDSAPPQIKKLLHMGTVSESQSLALRAAIKVRNGSARLLSYIISGCHCTPCNQIRPMLKPLPVPLNGPRISKLLFDVHGHEIFQNGLFNSDPHAGNVLMMKDGKLGLIDYGACMRITPQQRVDVARLFVAIADNDDDEVPKAFWKCGFKSKKMDSRLALLLAHLCFNRGPFPDDINRLAPKVGLPPEPTVMDLQAYVQLGKVDEIESFPGHLVLLQRCCMVLSGIGMELGAGRQSSAGMFKPQALKLLRGGASALSRVSLWEPPSKS